LSPQARRSFTLYWRIITADQRVDPLLMVERNPDQGGSHPGRGPGANNLTNKKTGMKNPGRKWKMRILLYTGKGGVGKTTIAAATALRCAQRGYRTLAISTDAAHSLADSFDLKAGAAPTEIAPRLWAQETELTSTVNEQWSTIQQWLTTLLAWRGLKDIVAEEMAFLPGMEELAYLLYLVNYAESGSYDVIVVDSAPTGETMRLLSFPEILNWWMKKLFPVQRQVARVMRPVIKPLTHLPMPDEEVLDSVQELFPQISKMRNLLADPLTTSIRLVVNPEKMVIKETQRAYTYLNLYGYATDLVVCNRLLPDRVSDHYFDYWKTNQDKYFKEIGERFAPLPIFSLPLMEQEVVGLKMLEKTGEVLYQDRDPATIFFQGKSHDLDKVDGRYILSFEFPYNQKEEISLIKNGDELIVQVGVYRRNILLPRTIANLEVDGAKFENQKLVIKFAAANPGEAPTRSKKGD
jgi:arsenite/tail-anchored protein-transporting ATPase